MAQQYVMPEEQIANLLQALQALADCKPYNGQLQDIRKEIEYIRHEFARFQAGKLEPIPVRHDPFVSSD